MEKDRSSKVIAIVALLIGVVGLSVGFAAFSNSLNIQSSLNVKPDSSTFNVDFSSSDSTVQVEEITPSTTEGVKEATNGNINNANSPVISNLGATFTAPGQSVTYKFYTYNAGQYNAFLKSIIYNNVANKGSNKVCTELAAETNYVSNACEDIVLEVTVGNSITTKESKADIDNHRLDIGKAEQVTVTIKYEQKDNQQRADGDFKVEFGDITLSYSSVD